MVRVRLLRPCPDAVVAGRVTAEPGRLGIFASTAPLGLHRSRWLQVALRGGEGGAGLPERIEPVKVRPPLAVFSTAPWTCGSERGDEADGVCMRRVVWDETGEVAMHIWMESKS